MISILVRRLAWPRIVVRGMPREAAVRYFVSVGTVALIAAAVAFVFRFGSNCPVQDEWDMVRPLLERPVRWNWVWEYHNEHRYIPTRILWSAVLLATGFDFRVGMVLTVALHAAAALALIALTRRLRGETRAIDLLIPVLLLNWGHHFNFLMSYQFTFGFVLVAAVGLLATAVRAEPGRELRTGFIASGWLLFAMLHGGFGLAITPPVLAWIGYLAFRAIRRGDTRAAWLAVPVLLVIAYVGETLLHQPKTQAEHAHPPLLDLLRGVRDYFGLPLGPWVITAECYPFPAYPMLALHLGALVLVGRVALRQPAERPRALGYLAILFATFVTAFGISWSRGGAIATHYVTTACIGPCAAWLILANYGPPLGRFPKLFLYVFGAGILALNANLGHREGLIQRGYLKGLQIELSNGTPPLFAAGMYGGRFFVTPSCHAVLLEFERRRIGPYLATVSDPPYASVPVSMAATMPACYDITTATPLDVPAASGRVYGLRLVVDSLEYSPWAAWELSWTAPTGERRRALAYPPHFPMADREVLFWVNGTARDVKLVTQSPTAGFRLHSAEWLVPVQ